MSRARQYNGVSPAEYTMFPNRFLSSIKARRNVSPNGKQVVVLASYLDEELSYVQVSVKQKGSKTMQVMSIMTNSHEESLRAAIEKTEDTEVKAYLRTALCDILD